MRNYTKKWYTVLAVAVTVVFTACSTEDNTGVNPAPNPNIAQIVALDPEFSFLNAAVNRANLSSALAASNITLLAPDNNSFKASGIADINAINAIPVSQLQSILSYHIVTRSIPFASIPKSDTLRTVNSQNVYASKYLNGTFLNGITIKTKDRQGSNGYIQIVEKLLTPPAPTKSIASAIANDSSYSFLFKAITKLNLLTLLGNPNKLTVFAPNNAAFRAAGITDIDAVPVATLDPIIKAHVLPSNYWSTDVVPTLYYATVDGARNLQFNTTPTFGVKIVGGTKPFSVVTTANIICTNGIIHNVDRVILP